MFSTSDTIVAIATPPGRGGIGVVRLSGPDAHAIARRLVRRRDDFEPRRATFTKVRPTAVDDVRLKPDATNHRQSSTPQPSVVASGLSPTHDGDAIDHAVVTYFPAPDSYTGDDVVEISAHGSPVVLRSIVTAGIACGARLAEPGEFTLRAFLNGRIDLPQAEAVADLIDAATPLQARAAFDQLEGTLTRAIRDMDTALFDLIARLEASVDFPDEGYHFVDARELTAAIDALCARTAALLVDGRRGRLIREGLQVAIVGRPNVGKSSLFNALVGSARAIVTDVPGTTRDLVTEVIDLEGVRVTLVDTAGLRDAADAIEAEGVARSMQSVSVADLVLQVVVDDEPTLWEHAAPAEHVAPGERPAPGEHPARSEHPAPGEHPAPSEHPARSEHPAPSTQHSAPSPRLIVQNKADLRDVADARPGAVSVSARTGAGLDNLRSAIVGMLDAGIGRDRPDITNVRHIALVARAHDALTRARDASAADGGALSEEFVLADLQDARGAFEEITGRRTQEDVLTHIFERFCIGK